MAMWVPSVSTKPKAGESRRGYVIRACERNGWPSLISFLKPTGITSARFGEGSDPKELCDALGLRAEWWEIFSEDHQNLQSTYFGHTLPAARVRRSVRHICPACLDEERYQRAWWDLDVFSTCPTHSLPLTTSCGCGKPLGWSDPSLDHCKNCYGKQSNLQLSCALPIISSFEAYVLGRLGLHTVAKSDLLDRLPLAHAIDFVEDIAALMAGGYTMARPRWEGSPQSSRLRDIAFEEISQDNLSKLFNQVVEQFRARYDERTPRYPGLALGWFGDRLSHYAEFEDVDIRCRSSLSNAIGFPVHDLAITEYVDLHVVANDLKYRPDNLLEKISRMGRLHLCSGGGEHVYLPIDLLWELKSGSPGSPPSAA